MKQKSVHQMKIDDRSFKKVKENKKSVIVTLNDEKKDNIRLGDKMLFINSKNKKLKKKIKKLYNFKSFEELYKAIDIKKLGYKKKDNYKEIEDEYSKNDIKEHGLLAIEVKRKKRILFKIFFTLVTIVALVLVISTVRGKINDYKAKKVNEKISELSKEKIDYAFIEINPSFVLSIRDNKVLDVACLNDDCISFYNEIEVIGKTADESIGYLYDLAKNKGFDTTNGVSVKTTGNLNISKNKDYVRVEYIGETTKNELLNEVKNNEDIKNDSNDEYYNNLWEELKKDPDYGEVYDCKMNNDELECYFIMDAITPPLIDFNEGFVDYFDKRSKVINVLTKFGVERCNNTDIAFCVYIGGLDFSFTSQFSISNGNTNENYMLRMILLRQIKKTTYENVDGFQIPHYEMGFDYIFLKDINLLKPDESLNKMVKYRV